MAVDSKKQTLFDLHFRSLFFLLLLYGAKFPRWFGSLFCFFDNDRNVGFPGFCGSIKPLNWMLKGEERVVREFTPNLITPEVLGFCVCEQEGKRGKKEFIHTCMYIHIIILSHCFFADLLFFCQKNKFRLCFRFFIISTAPPRAVSHFSAQQDLPNFLLFFFFSPTFPIPFFHFPFPFPFFPSPSNFPRTFSFHPLSPPSLLFFTSPPFPSPVPLLSLGKKSN